MTNTWMMMTDGTFDNLNSNELTSTYPLIDTHTHFDDDVFDEDRVSLAQSAYRSGVRHLLLIGYVAKYFERMQQTKQQLVDLTNQGLQVPKPYLAVGLHPAYIAQHSESDLEQLAQLLDNRNAKQSFNQSQSFNQNQNYNQSQVSKPIAIGEIGLDTFTDELKSEASVAKQKKFFKAQLDLAVRHELPVLLHIRKAHADCLAMLKQHKYDAQQLGGIAHSFSGGEQEAKAFVKLGFKLGVTGQVTNPNAKKLRRAIKAAVAEYGLSCLVLETDCPDMTPICCQQGSEPTRNVPGNLKFALQSLTEILQVDEQTLARQLWQNSCEALRLDWSYPDL